MAVNQEFFPEGDLSREPRVSDSYFVLNNCGLCLMNTGRLHEAIPILERTVEKVAAIRDSRNVCRGRINLAELYIRLGELDECAKQLWQAQAASTVYAREILQYFGLLTYESVDNQRHLLVLKGWHAFLAGFMEDAGAFFHDAEVMERDLDQASYLGSSRGIFHADYLRRAGDTDYARRVIDWVLTKFTHVPADISLGHRVLGDLDADSGQHESAHEHYEKATAKARRTFRRYVLIEALAARGRWLARRSEVEAALNDLQEALDYSLVGGYRLDEADVRVGLAWVHLAAGNVRLAQEQAIQAQRMSAEMGYHWGKVDAEEVLAALDRHE